MSARDALRKYVSLLADWWTPPSVTEERVERLYGQVRAEVLREAAGFVRDAHFTDGMSVQEIGTALGHMADDAALQELLADPAGRGDGRG